ncbi:MAG TPA: FkbM family methyltransferase [Thermoanaerobaculia bacterium]|jgi:FkbM family methyltransferase
MAASLFATDYDLGSRRVIRPRGRSFELVVTPRYEHHYLAQSYEALTADLLVNLLCGRKVFVDVGAHCGFFSLLAATRHPELKVLALEPVEENRQLLREGIQRNAVDAAVEVVASAVSDHCGKGRFYIAEASDNCSFYPHPATATLRTIDVATVTLDSLLSGRHGAATAVVKIDTDGHEIATLAGMREVLTTATDLRLIVELNPKMQRLAGHTPEDLVAELQRLGFEVFLVDDSLRRFLRLRNPGDWRAGCPDQGYANLYCAPQSQALSVVIFAHSSGLHGAERSLLGNVTAFVQDQGAVCTVVLPGEGPLRERLDSLGAATVGAELPWWCDSADVAETAAHTRLESRLQLLLRDVLPAVERAGSDVVETMTLVLPWGALTAVLLDLPHVWHVCEYGENDHGLRFSAPFAQILATVDATSNLILTPSDTLRRSLFPDLPAERCQAIGRWISAPPAGLELVAARDARRRFRLGVFATLAEGKDQATAVHALAELVRRGYDAELLLAGDAVASYREALLALCARLGLEGRVELPGFLPDPFPAMAAVDVVLVCAPLEAFGRTGVEATLVGKSVVCTRTSAMTEFLADGREALWFEPGDALDLADKLERLLQEPDLGAALSRHARKVVSARFSRQVVSSRRYELFRRLRGEPNPAGGNSVVRLLGGSVAHFRREAAQVPVIARELAATRAQLAGLEQAHRELKVEQVRLAEEARELSEQFAVSLAERDDLSVRFAASRRERDSLSECLHRTMEECEALRREHDWIAGSATWRWRSRLLRVPGVARGYRALRNLFWRVGEPLPSKSSNQHK